MPVSDNPENRKVIERPLNHDVKSLRLKRGQEFQKHLKQRREKSALMARGGVDRMENEYLKSRHEREMAQLEEISQQYQDNDYCHAVMDEEDMFDYMQEIDAKEMEELAEQLYISNSKDEPRTTEGSAS